MEFIFIIYVICIYINVILLLGFLVTLSRRNRTKYVYAIFTEAEVFRSGSLKKKI